MSITLTLVVLETEQVRCMQQTSANRQPRQETSGGCGSSRRQARRNKARMGHGHGRAVSGMTHVLCLHLLLSHTHSITVNCFIAWQSLRCNPLHDCIEKAHTFTSSHFKTQLHSTDSDITKTRRSILNTNSYLIQPLPLWVHLLQVSTLQQTLIWCNVNLNQLSYNSTTWTFLKPRCAIFLQSQESTWRTLASINNKPSLATSNHQLACQCQRALYTRARGHTLIQLYASICVWQLLDSHAYPNDGVQLLHGNLLGPVNGGNDLLLMLQHDSMYMNCTCTKSTLQPTWMQPNEQWMLRITFWPWAKNQWIWSWTDPQL